MFICRVLSIHDSALCIRGFSLFIYLLAVSLYVAAIVSDIVPWLLWIVSQHFATHQTGSVHCSASWSAVCCWASGMPLLCVRCILLALSRAFLFYTNFQTPTVWADLDSFIQVVMAPVIFSVLWRCWKSIRLAPPVVPEVFLPRDTMVARCTMSSCVHPSVHR